MTKPADLPPIDFSGVIDEMAYYFETAPWQIRQSLRPDDRLMKVARARAVDMATNNYFGHVDLDGIWPNEHVRLSGYELPYRWPDNKNYIESIAQGYGSAVRALDALSKSPAHSLHMMGLGFWENHDRYGVGFAWIGIQRRWVVITAPRPEGPRPPEEQHAYLPSVHTGARSLTVKRQHLRPDSVSDL